MTSHHTHPSVILFMSNKSRAGHESVRQWFANSRFNTCEAADVFQALEKLCDFTTRLKPDVILLEVDSPAEQFRLFQRVVDESADICDHEVFALRENGKTINSDGCFEGDLEQLASRLEGLIPQDIGVAA